VRERVTVPLGPASLAASSHVASTSTSASITNTPPATRTRSHICGA
jgi:hypothetical protein